MKMKTAIVLCLVIPAACARTSTVDLSADTAMIVTDAAPVCGAAGAMDVAQQHAAITTIKRGYDSFRILRIGAGRYGVGSTNVGGPNIMTLHKWSRHKTTIRIKMFRGTEGGGVAARAVLGGNWQRIVQSGGPSTC